MLCEEMKKLCAQTCHSKTSTFSDVESMSGGLFDRAMKYKLGRKIDIILRLNMHIFVLFEYFDKNNLSQSHN